MIISVNSRMDSGRDPQRFNIGAKTAQKIVSQTRRLRFVKEKTLVQVVKRLFGDSDHPRPNADLTVSQFGREDSPRAARARRSSRSFLTSSGTGMDSNCSCMSCHRVSMMRNFCPTGIAFTSEIVIKWCYHTPSRRASDREKIIHEAHDHRRRRRVTSAYTMVMETLEPVMHFLG